MPFRLFLCLAIGCLLSQASPLFAADDLEPLHTLKGHVNNVSALAYSPDGRWLASGGVDKTVRLWNAVTGELVHTLVGHEGEISSLAFRPDSYLLVSSSFRDGRGEVRIWNVNGGKPFRQYAYESPVLRVACGPKNTFAVACANGLVEQRYSCTGNVVLSNKPTDRPLRFVGFRGGATLLAATGGNKPALWNLVTREETTCDKFHSFGANCVALSPDGKTVATGGVYELSLWDAQTGALHFAAEGIHGHTNALAFTPDGQTVVTGGNNCKARADKGERPVEVNFWNVSTGKLSADLPGKRPDVRNLAISPDGNTLATSSGKGPISLWSTSAAKAAAE